MDQTFFELYVQLNKLLIKKEGKETYQVISRQILSQAFGFSVQGDLENNMFFEHLFNIVDLDVIYKEEENNLTKIVVKKNTYNLKRKLDSFITDF